MHARSVAFVALTIAACGGSVALPDGPTSDQFGAAAARAFCTALSTCCHDASFPYDDGACLSQMTEHYQLPITDALKNGHAHYNRGISQACIDVIAADEARCADYVLRPPVHDFNHVSPCIDIVVGDLQPGDACESNGECAREVGVKSSEAACVEPVYVGIIGATGKICDRVRYDGTTGGACGRSGATRTFCDPETSVCDSNICLGYAAIGDSCSPALWCQPSTAFCDPVRGVCAPSRETGEACDDEHPCNYDHILTCDKKTSRCVAVTVTDGAPCTPDGCGWGRSCQNGICQADGEFHLPDVSKRSCGHGPLSVGLENGD